ncbi:hypothetical protein [Arthrobacter bambusae]|uniref:hypothetical protein n=1 Tax=Arthrobacter bambusae TaxID=1338426 RepID=UPI00277EF751|nr:hypothetical protein [Arthrobacter bambusae]MDQ0241229.1 hypothetical protein [Arthrobacter bambusae]
MSIITTTEECDHDYHFGICQDCGGVTEDFDGAPMTQAEVTSGYVNPSQERMAAWQNKMAARR